MVIICSCCYSTLLYSALQRITMHLYFYNAQNVKSLPLNVNSLKGRQDVFIRPCLVNRQHRHLRQIVKSREFFTAASQAAGHKHLQIIFFIKTVNIFRKPALVPSIQAA